MEAYEVVGAPVVRGSDPLGEARRVACSELFGRGVSRQADLEVPVVAEKRRETETCVVGYVLFTGDRCLRLRRSGSAGCDPDL